MILLHKIKQMEKQILKTQQLISLFLFDFYIFIFIFFLSTYFICYYIINNKTI